MANVQFNDFLQAELQNPNFREGYQAKKAILESVLATDFTKKKAPN